MQLTSLCFSVDAKRNIFIKKDYTIPVYELFCSSFSHFKNQKICIINIKTKYFLRVFSSM